MASQTFASFETLLRGFHLIRCNRLAFVKPKWSTQSYADWRGRLFSTSAWLANKSGDSNSFEEPGKDPLSGQRNDLERLKLLLERKTHAPQSDQKEKEAKQAKENLSSSVNVNKFRDVLSSLSLKQETRKAPLKKKRDSRQRSPTYVSRGAEAIKKETEKIPVPRVAKVIGKETEKGTESVVKSDNEQPSIKASQIKDALSILGQDHSTSATEDVILAGRHQQVAPESLSAMEGLLSIKQRQIRDKDSKKYMPKNSLCTGSRLHWFDDVREKWSGDALSSMPTLFQEMAKKEVHDMGTSVSVQSGFHDLIENIDRQWSFPIDNETCKIEEENVGFDQHVFLEHMLNEFPTSGNTRQFMELVVTGLQQNPHLSVKEKTEHILWFKEYFENMPDEPAHI